MSTHDLKLGDRIQVTAQSRVRGCQPGDEGMVFSGPHHTPDDGWHYYVTMNKDETNDRPSGFRADDIESDV